MKDKQQHIQTKKIHTYMLCKSMRKIPLFGLLLIVDILPNTTSEFVQNLKKTIKRFEKTMKIYYCHSEGIRTGGSLNCIIYLLQAGCVNTHTAYLFYRSSP